MSSGFSGSRAFGGGASSLISAVGLWAVGNASSRISAVGLCAVTGGGTAGVFCAAQGCGFWAEITTVGADDGVGLDGAGGGVGGATSETVAVETGVGTVAGDLSSEASWA